MSKNAPHKVIDIKPIHKVLYRAKCKPNQAIETFVINYL